MELLGIPAGDRESVKRWSDDKVALQWGNLTLDEHLAHARGFVEFQRYLKELTDERRRRPNDDFVSLLAQAAPNERPLSDPELVGQLTGLISAGHETTTSLIAHACILLLADRRRWETVVRRPDVIPAVVEEALRFDSPVMGMLRTTTEDVHIAGVDIPAGARVQLMFSSANRDESVFERGGEFNFLRTTSPPHLAFGHGIHFCIGAALGRLECRVALALLTGSFPDLALCTDQAIAYRPNAAFRAPVAVRVAWPYSADKEGPKQGVTT
jgi:cytochrome P450